MDVLDPRHAEGLLDLIALGNVLELSYTWEFVDSTESQEAKRHRTRISGLYQQFQRDFATTYGLKTVNGTEDPLDGLFRPSLLQFAVSIINYKNMMEGYETKISPATVRRMILQHFRGSYPLLVPELAAELGKPQDQLDYCKTFEWTGERFEVVKWASGTKRRLDSGK
jgi:hypothetical protein